MPTREEISVERKRLRSRIKGFYDHFGKREWQKCFQLLDPELRERKVDYEEYVKSLSSFYDHFGPITIKLAELDVFLRVKNKGFGNRDFAYGLLVWHDKRHEPHLLKERWVRTGENWYTRMVGLVVNQNSSGINKDSSH